LEKVDKEFEKTKAFRRIRKVKFKLEKEEFFDKKWIS
jgi:hypothetical protein